MTSYFRPLPQSSGPRPKDAFALAGGPLWFIEAVALQRDAKPEIIPAKAIPDEVLARLTAPRAPVAGMDMGGVTLMGILNVTPDSFSDGGRYASIKASVEAALKMEQQGAAIIDIGCSGNVTP